VDQGCFHEQTVVKPALPVTRLTWQWGACAADPVTGQPVYQRAGLYWVQTPRTECEVQKVWCPNVVAQQVAQTTYVPQTVTQQVPMQVCKYVPEQVCRKVPVQVCRMVTEQFVRKVPVTTCRMVYEERVDRVPYQVCRMVAEQGVVQVPRCVEKRIPVTYTCNVPRLVCYRVPLDACGEPISAVSTPPTGVAPAMASPQQPTPAKKTLSADVKPELGPEVAAPRPVDADEKPPVKEAAPLKPVPPPAKSPVPQSQPYPSKST
jgi:hypothetical protein